MNQPNKETVRSFEEISQEVAKRFLHTVVLVDDRAFEKQKDAQNVEPNEVENVDLGLTDPGAAFFESKETGSAAVDNAPEPLQTARERDAEQLDARLLMATFAKEGLICAVIEPLKAADAPATLEQAGKAAKRADVVILDWDIHKDQGQSTRQIISEILRGDKENPDRLRLILIYTGAPDVETILNKVANDLPAGQHKFEPKNHYLVASHGAWRIKLIGKPGSIRERVPGSKVEEASVYQLPDVICREFAQMTQGLVRNVALASLATLRNNTHTLLGHLTTELDPAYVAHRTLLPTPEEAEHHAVELIAGELGAMLHSFEVGTSAAGAEALRAWLRLRETYNIDLKNGKAVSAKDIEQSVIHGTLVPGLSKNQWAKDATTILAGGDEALAKKANQGLAVSMSLSRRYANPSEQGKSRRLTLGTIVKRIGAISGEGDFLLCLQPRCDCVRIKPEKEVNGRSFIFVSCAKVNENERHFHIVVPVRDSDKVVHQQLKIDMSKPVILRFLPKNDDGGVVLTSSHESVDVFGDLDNGKYEWIGQLKEAQAQGFANDFAMKLGRVGLNEHEWLRRAAEKT